MQTFPLPSQLKEDTMTQTELEQAKLAIGARLREARKAKGITQEKLAKLASTTQAVIQKIENGKAIHTRIVDRLALALQVNPAWLQWGKPFAGRRVE